MTAAESADVLVVGAGLAGLHTATLLARSLSAVLGLAEEAHVVVVAPDTHLAETTAVVGVTRELGVLAPPKPIGLTINYLRSGRALDSYARVSIVKQGRRVVAFEAQAWQDDPAKPVAILYGRFLLVDGADDA